MKKYILKIVSCIFFVVFFISCKNIKMIASEEKIIKTENIKSIKYQNNINSNLLTKEFIEIEKEKHKSLLDILNKAKYNKEMNDGRMVKMKENDFTIQIKYNDEVEESILFWSNLMKVNKTWYSLDEKKVLDILNNNK